MVIAGVTLKLKKDKLHNYSLASELYQGLVISDSNGSIKYIDNKARELLGLDLKSKYTSLNSVFDHIQPKLSNANDAASIYSAIITAPTLSYTDTLNFIDGRRVKRTSQASKIQQNIRLWQFQEISFENAGNEEERFNSSLLEHQAAEYAKIAEELFHAKEEMLILANTDPLTDLHNRRSFMDESKKYISTVADDQQTAVLMADIDKFKAINDTYGHAIGDLCIKSVSALLKKNSPSNSCVSRMGGEEFACFFPIDDISQAKSTAEHIRHSIEQAQLLAGKPPLAMTISIGVSLLGKKEKTIEAAIARADEALYESKNNGRNRVSINISQKKSRQNHA